MGWSRPTQNIPTGTDALERDAARIVDVPLGIYGPGSQALSEILAAWVSAPPGGREALFLALAVRVAGPDPKTSSLRPIDGDHHAQ